MDIRLLCQMNASKKLPAKDSWLHRRSSCLFPILLSVPRPYCAPTWTTGVSDKIIIAPPEPLWTVEIRSGDCEPLRLWRMCCENHCWLPHGKSASQKGRKALLMFHRPLDRPTASGGSSDGDSVRRRKAGYIPVTIVHWKWHVKESTHETLISAASHRQKWCRIS